MTRPRHRPAFTLLEVLLVIAVIIALSAVAYPTLTAMYGDVKLKAAGDDVRAAWTEARSHAIEDGRAYRFSVQPGTGKYRVAPDADGFWDGSGGGGGESDAPPWTFEADLPKGIVFETAADLPESGGWATVVVFNPDGGCSADVEITLKEADDDGTPIVVKVRAMTGAVSVRKQPRGDR
jgi:Tfp pilus assembly protein FimT